MPNFFDQFDNEPQAVEETNFFDKFDVEEPNTPQVFTGKKETGETSAITTEPITEPVPTTEEPADFLTFVKTGFVDDPETQIKIYSKARGIPADKYTILEDGDIAYLAGDGMYHREKGEDLAASIKKFGGESVARTPAAVMGGIGATAGPVAAMAGAAGGEGIRKSIGGLMFAEPQTTGGNIKSMGIEGAIEGATYGLAKGANATLNYAGRKRAGNLAEAAGRDVKTISVPDTQAAIKQAEQFGIDLPIPAATESRKLTSKYKLLRDSDATADIIQESEKKLVGQMQDGQEILLDSISPKKATRYELGEDLSKASRERIDGISKARSQAASPIYKEAFRGGTKVDIKPVIDFIDAELKTAKGRVRAELIRAKGILSKPDLPKKDKISPILNAKGGKIISEKAGHDTSLKGLHGSKVEIGRIIDTAKQDSLGNVIKGKYQRIQSLLLKQMDAASPKYKEARGVFSSASGVIDELTKGRKIVELSKLNGDNYVQALQKTFSAANTSPEAIHYLRTLINRQSPELWDSAVRGYVQEVFDKTVKRAGMAGNFPGNFWKDTMLDKNQNKILKAALGKKYKTLEDFSEVMRRISLIYGKESATATRQASQQEMKSAGTTLASKVVRGVRSLGTSTIDWIDDITAGNYNQELAEAMVSPKAAKQLQKLKQLSPGSEKFLLGMESFIGLIAAGEFASSAKIQINTTGQR